MIKVRELRFESVAECAAHFGVSEKHVKTYIRAGRLDVLGVGSSKRGRKVPRDPDKLMKVVVRGRVFASVTECARHFGISTSTVYGLLGRGRAHSIGLGAKRPRKGPGSRSQAIIIGPLSFPSRCAASRALGFSNGYVSCALRGKTGYQWTRVVAAAMALTARQTRERMEAERIASKHAMQEAA